MRTGCGGYPVSAVPSPAQLAVIAELQGLSLDAGQLATAATFHQGLRAQLEQLRRIPLSFLEPVVEPVTALRWIESGGEP